MEPAGIFVGALAELAAGVQIRQHQLDGWHFELRMHVDGNAAPVVPHRNRTVDMDGHFNFRAVTGEMFIDRVIENFENHVMQAALIRVPNIHSGAFANGLEALQFVDLRGIIFLSVTDAGRVGLTFPIVRIFVVRKRQSSCWHIQRKR